MEHLSPNESAIEEELQNATGEFKYRLASSLIKDARFSRIHIAYQLNAESLKFYELYYNPWLQGAYYFFLWLNLGIIFFEEPASFIEYIGEIPSYYIALINILCILYFFFRWLHQMKCSVRKEFWGNKLNIATIVILVLMVIDLTMYLSMKYASPKTSRFQWSRALRPFLCATFPENYRIRSAIKNIKGTLVDILIVFSLFLFLLAFFALLVLQFLGKSNLFYPNGSPYFRNYFDVIFDLYVLVTTSNSPDVIIPAYERSHFYVIFYLLVTIVCNWILMGITVASVYNAYKTHLGETVIENVRKKKHCLRQAFNLLKIGTPGEIFLPTFCTVMRKVDPRSTEAQNILLFKLLDLNKSNNLSLGQFTKLTEFMHLSFEEIPINVTFFQKQIPAFYWCYMSKFNQKIKPIIRSKYTRLFFEFLIFVNCVLMLVFADTKAEKKIKWVFTMIFVGELCLHIFACGVNLFFKDLWNIFDFIVIVTAALTLILQEIVTFFKEHLGEQYFRVLLALRVLRLLKILTVIRSYKSIVHCIFILIPSLLTYAAVQLSIYYIYICIGMEAFGYRYFPPVNNTYEIVNSTDTVDCGDERLKNTDFVKSHYCILNFNSASDGFFLMTILTVSNNWHILLMGATLTTHQVTKMFFVSIHWFCVLLVMNIVLAFIIDAYLVQKQSSEGHFEHLIETRLVELGISANEELKKRNLQGFGTAHFDLSKEMLQEAFPQNALSGPVCFRLNESAPKDMETLLQRMFEDDIEKLQEEFMKYDLKPLKNSIPNAKAIEENSLEPHQKDDQIKESNENA